jgi:hypothetical protein
LTISLKISLAVSGSPLRKREIASSSKAMTNSGSPSTIMGIEGNAALKEQ